MRKKQALELKIEQLPQRSSHDLLIGAVLGRQERKSERLEVDQRVADDERSAIVVEMKRDLAGGRAFDRNRR